jgi:hypothetical protein
MLATSTLILPQQAMIEILLQPDYAGNTASPAYFNISTNAFMLNRKLISLQAFTNNDVVYSPISPGVRVLSGGNVFRSTTLTLLRQPGNGIEGGDFYKNIPLYLLRRTWDRNNGFSAAPDQWRCDPTEVSWSDSYVNVNAPINIGTVTSVLFLATFLLPEQDPEPYRLIHLNKH